MLLVVCSDYYIISWSVYKKLCVISMNDIVVNMLLGDIHISYANITHCT